MTNREWLLNKMQNMSDEEFATKLEDFIMDNEYICKIMSKECEDIGDCTECIIKWLKQEHKEKITLSEAERIILENIDKEYKWIARDSDGDLILSTEKYHIQNLLMPLNHLFQFIKKKSEPYNIEELIKEDKYE